MGEHEFNKRSKTKELKPVSEIVTVPVPPHHRPRDLRCGAGALKARNPKVTPAARHQRPDHAHRPDPLRQVRRGHDHSHRQEAGAIATILAR
jgi:hypothetical protein